VLQSGARPRGVGLGAGVGGEAGAEGSRLWGIVDAIGLVGVCIGRGGGGREDDMGALRFESDEGAGNAGGGGGNWVSCSIMSSNSSDLSIPSMIVDVLNNRHASYCR
jgi:hypothetical protein